MLKNSNDLRMVLSEPLEKDPPEKLYLKNREPDLTCLTELIKNNDIEMENAEFSKIKLLKSPEIKLVPEVRIRSPEKKIRLDVKPEIIQLSSDDDSDFEMSSLEDSSKRKILIGKNVEKVPELSVSNLERQLVSIVSDATNLLKQHEETEKKIQQQLEIRSSVDVINTISKGPPALG